MIDELAKMAAQYMAMKAVTHATGGGLSGLLLSSVAMKGVDKLFDRKKGNKPDHRAETQQSAVPDDQKVISERSAEEIGKRIGDAAAAGIERILREKFPPQPSQQTAQSHQGTAGGQPGGAQNPNELRPNQLLDDIFGPKGGGDNKTEIPRPNDTETPREYIRRLTSDQRERLFPRSGGSEPNLPPEPVAPRAATGAAEAAEGSAATRLLGGLGRAVGLGGVGSAGAAGTAGGGAAAGAGAAGAGGAAAGAGGAGAAGTAGAAIVGSGPAAPIVAVGVAAAFAASQMYEVAKQGKELAYGQEQLSKRLGEINPTIGSQQQELDMKRIFRDMDTGDKLKGSNQRLLDSIDKFETSMKPIEDLANIVKNAVGSATLDVITETIETTKGLISSQYDALVELVQLLSLGKLRLPHSDEIEFGEKALPGQGFGDFLADIHRQEEMKRQQEEARRQENRRAMDDAGKW